MSHHQPVIVDPRELERAQSVWHNFTQLIKWSVIGIAATLAVMAALFVDW